MALHKDFPESPYNILDPALRWFPADEALRESSMDKLDAALGATTTQSMNQALLCKKSIPPGGMLNVSP